MLHRLLRGTGLRGLRGIAPRRELEPGLTVIRPLLTSTRAQILAYLEELDQAFREDQSNTDLRYTRNRIRHRLLPQLVRRFNPAIVEVLARLARQAEEAYRIAEDAALTLLSAAELPRAGALLIFDRQRLLTAPRHQVREMFRQVWTREDWPRGGMDHAAWDRLASVVFDKLSAVDLPGGLRTASRTSRAGGADISKGIIAIVFFTDRRGMAGGGEQEAL